MSESQNEKLEAVEAAEEAAVAEAQEAAASEAEVQEAAEEAVEAEASEAAEEPAEAVEVQEVSAEEPTAKPTKSKKIKTMQEKDLKKVVSAQKVFKVIAQILLYLFLGSMALVIIFPFYWMIISSLKSVQEYELPIPTLFPQTIV